jgi:hypothetical protein
MSKCVVLYSRTPSECAWLYARQPPGAHSIAGLAPASPGVRPYHTQSLLPSCATGCEKHRLCRIASHPLTTIPLQYRPDPYGPGFNMNTPPQVGHVAIPDQAQHLHYYAPLAQVVSIT